MKTILIDARMYGTKHTGIGRYVRNLILNLIKLKDFNKFKWMLLAYPEQVEEIKQDIGDSCKIIGVNIQHYSIAEQIKLPSLIASLNPDLVHFTNFNKPILYRKKSVITIHDLIKHFSKGSDTTTRNQSWYWIKYVAYRLLTDWNIREGNIIVPSNFWRNYLINKFKIDPEKVTTTYEAVDSKLLEMGSRLAIKRAKDYILYTGNIYPHKNLEVILRLLKIFPKIKLKIICARSVFLQRWEEKVKEMGLKNRVDFLGYVPDAEFKEIYQEAIALVHPSKLEGFSLTGLEAMALNCPVVAANASCLPEIYGESVLYFEPDDENDLKSKLEILMKSPDMRNKMIAKGREQLKKYSFRKMAEETMAVYTKILYES